MSSDVPQAQRSLILITKPTVNERWDFELVADHVRALADDVSVNVLDDCLVEWSQLPPEGEMPTLTVSPGPLWHFRPPRGTVCEGESLPKAEEYVRLERAGVPVPAGGF